MFNSSPPTFKQFITKPQVERNATTSQRSILPFVDPYDTDIRDALERAGHAHLAQYDEIKAIVQKPFKKEGI